MGPPDAVARYASDLVPSSSDAARRRLPFAISPLCQSRRAFRVVDGKIEWRSGRRPVRSNTK
eukprot:1325106-Alexandrium_andersonii.AAC.1